MLMSGNEEPPDKVSGSCRLSSPQGQFALRPCSSQVLPCSGRGCSTNVGQCLIASSEQGLIINLREDFQLPPDSGIYDFPSQFPELVICNTVSQFRSL